jgi:hypothetical protein
MFIALDKGVSCCLLLVFSNKSLRVEFFFPLFLEIIDRL